MMLCQSCGENKKLGLSGMELDLQYSTACIYVNCADEFHMHRHRVVRGIYTYTYVHTHIYYPFLCFSLE